MDVARPHRSVSSGLDLEVLRVLAGTTRPLSGREVARLAGASQRGVAAALARLADHGIVIGQAAGPAVMFTLNRDHLAAPPIEALSQLRVEFLRRLRAAFEAWDPAPEQALLFGSAARGDGDADSDIDLFVVRPRHIDEDHQAWRDQIGQLATSVFSWTGNHAAIVELDEADTDRGGAVGGRVVAAPVWDAIARDAIHLAGRPAAELLPVR